MKVFWAFLFSTVCLFADGKLRIYDDSSYSLIHKTSDYEEIRALLGSIGVLFEKWEASKELSNYATQEDVLAAYQDDVDRLLKEYKSVDVVRMGPDSPKKGELRQKFLNEHTHSEDEVRFFVEGAGLFYLHVGSRVYIVLCEKGDLISIPPGYNHWFDMGTEPYFTAIRFFIEPAGWIANFTGSDISQSLPKFGE